MSFKKFSSGLLACVLLTGCASLQLPKFSFPSLPFAAPTAEQRLSTAKNVAAEAGFQQELIETSPFSITSYVKIKKEGGPLHVYIEGDGYAWVTRNRISADPTPRDPLVLELAVQDKASNVAYLARPCQYTPMEKNPSCQEEYWTSKRFSQEAVSSMNQAVEKLVQEAKATELHLIGYSGGGAVAALIAAWRTDVKSLTTIAGNLDPVGLNEYHQVSPLDTASLTPLNVAEKLREIPQNHFRGSKDAVIPKQVPENFAKQLAPSKCIHLLEVTDADHTSGWKEIWPKLLTYPLSCTGPKNRQVCAGG